MLYGEAAEVIGQWQAAHRPSLTLVLVDQPTIFVNGGGQRPVEHIVCPSVSRRRGRIEQAGAGFLARFDAQRATLERAA